MASIDIVPTKDTYFNLFQSVVYSTCNTNKVAWAIPQADIDVLTPLQTTWAAAWAAAMDANNRTHAQVVAKDDVRTEYEEELRPFIQRNIQDNANVPNEGRESMGIKPHDTIRTRVPVPDTTPELAFEQLSGNRIKVRATQQPGADGISRRGKPEGVARVELRMFLLPDSQFPPPDPAFVYFSSTKTIFELQLDPEDAGKRLIVKARWFNPRNEPGPWSDAFSVVVA